MKKVKQMFRVTVARLAGPQFKIIAHHKNLVQFGKVVKAFPKYFPNPQPNSVPLAHEATKAQQIDVARPDKLGLLNLIPSGNANEAVEGLGDFQGVNPSTFVHALRLPKQEIDFADFNVSEVETVNSEPLNHSEVFKIKLHSKKVKGREGRPFERAYHRVKNITQNLRVVNVEDVMRQLRRNGMGTPLVLAQQ